MKKKIILISMILSTSILSAGNIGGLIGLSYNFGGEFGFSVKALSTNKKNKGALSAGLSYFPMSQKIGFDVGGGYVFKNGAATIGWDFINSKPQVSIGYVNTAKDKTPPPAGNNIPNLGG